RDEGGLAGQSLIVGDRLGLRGGGDPLGDLEVEPTAAVDDRTRGQIEFAPPGNVGEVAEGADHGDACDLVGLRQFMCTNIEADDEERRAEDLDVYGCN